MPGTPRQRPGSPRSLADADRDVSGRAATRHCRRIPPSPGPRHRPAIRPAATGQATAPPPAGPLRPRRLSVTAIETWLRDPYAIHARYILKLPALKPLEEPTDAADYGILVHDGMHRFLQKHGAAWPPDPRGNSALAMARPWRGGEFARGPCAPGGPRGWSASPTGCGRPKPSAEPCGRRPLSRPNGGGRWISSVPAARSG